MTVRGTTNGNARGNTEDRRRRRAYLLQAYAANVAVVVDGAPVPTARCYRCGELLTDSTITVDRIVPGALGGTYRRNNIRPACSRCNSETGGAVRRNRS